MKIENADKITITNGPSGNLIKILYCLKMNDLCCTIHLF